MSITLYQSSKLNRQYNNVFSTKAILEEYLATLTNITVTGNFYMEYTGTLSLTLPLYTTACNYMKYIDNAGNANYYFIVEWNIKNDIYILTYVIDIWHTFEYKTDWNLLYAHQILTANSSFGTSNHCEMYDIVNPVTINAGQFNQVYDKFTYIAFGYSYTGVTDLEGPSKASHVCWIYGLSYDSSTGNITVNNGLSYDGACYQASQSYNHWVGNSITSEDNTYYFNITQIYIIPIEFVTQLFTNFSNGSGLYLNALIADYIYNKSYIAYELPFIYLSTEDFIVATTGTAYSNGSAQTFNLLFGTANNLIEVNKDIFRTTTFNIYFKISVNGLAIYLCGPGSPRDITEDFSYEIGYTAESALTAVNRNIAAKQDIVNSSLRATNSIINGVTSGITGVGSTMLQYNYQDAFLNSGRYGISQASNLPAINGLSNTATSFIDATNTIYQCILNRQKQYSEVRYSGSSVPNYKGRHGIVSYQITAFNVADITQTRKKYGYITSYYTNEIDISNDMNIFMCDDLNLYGSIPSQFIDLIKEILINGVRIWTTSSLNF